MSPLWAMYLPISCSEPERLRALEEAGLLDTAPEPEFDEITALAARIFNVPISLICLVDRDRQWLKSKHGLEVEQTPRDLAFCAFSILENRLLVVPDAADDERFASNPLVVGPPRIRFYAGAPLATRNGANLGSLCIMDTSPRAFSKAEETILAQLAAVIMTKIEARLAAQRLRQEIAAHEQTSNTLRRLEERYQRIAENTPGVVYQFVLRAAGTAEFLFVSGASREILELEPEALQADALAYFELIHPKDRGGRERAVAESIATLQPLHWEGRHILASGRMKRIQTSARPQRAANGDIFWDGVLVDVTVRRRTEDRLRMLENSVENANDAIVITEAEPVDEPGPRIIYVNKAFTKTTGYTEAEVLGKTPRILQGPKTDRETTRQIRSALKAWQAVRVELLNYRKDGTEFWEELNIVPVANEKGWFTHWVSVQRDITERKLFEAALLETRQKAQEAQAEAERANLAKSEFLSRMSHELRTPLNAILGFGQLLERSVLTTKQNQSVSYILSGGRHLLDLINEVLDISRIEAGKVELNIEAVHVAAALQETCALARPLAKGREISLNVSYAGHALDGAAVLADRQRFKQVLLNLISNAINYNRHSGRVDLTCERASTEGFLRLSVRDTGFGISPENLLRLFSPFERFHTTTTEVIGTGIGLAITKRLLEAMGGTISVDSKVGQGTTFSVELPLAAQVIQVAGGDPAKGEILSVEAQLPPVKHTILYIEDNLSNLTLVEQVLSERPGLKLLSAVNGAAGLKLAREHRPDLILLDVHLPDISGDLLLSQFKQDDLTRDIAVVIVSADATSTQIQRLLALGAMAYLTKPLDIPAFLRTIDKALAPLQEDSALGSAS